MDRKFRLALLAQRDSYIDRVVREFGTVSDIADADWPTDSVAVIFDCTHPDVSRHRQRWQRILEEGKTLGLIAMQYEDLQALEAITGRTFNASIVNLFVHASSAGTRQFRYTILPAGVEKGKMSPAEAAELLAPRVVHADCGGDPPPVAPPETINNIWPPNSEYGRLSASRQILIAGWPVSGWWGSPVSATSSLTFNAVGHFFWANGDGGDNDYHVIILSRMSNVSPLVGQNGSLFGFGLAITPTVNGSPLPALHVNTTQPYQNNAPPPPPNWGSLGNYMRTNFGYDPQVEIKTIGTPRGSNQQMTFILNPTFDEYRNSFTTPGLENFTIYPADTSSASWVQFNMFSGLYPNLSVPHVGAVHPDLSVTPPAEAGHVAEPRLAASDTDAFVVVSYFRFENPGKSSYSVDFEFNVQIFAAYVEDYWVSEYSRHVPIDLVAATQLQVVSEADQTG